jgi:hypothetical protein
MRGPRHASLSPSPLGIMEYCRAAGGPTPSDQNSRSLSSPIAGKYGNPWKQRASLGNKIRSILTRTNLDGARQKPGGRPRRHVAGSADAGLSQLLRGRRTTPRRQEAIPVVVGAACLGLSTSLSGNRNGRAYRRANSEFAQQSEYLAIEPFVQYTVVAGQVALFQADSGEKIPAHATPAVQLRWGQAVVGRGCALDAPSGLAPQSRLKSSAGPGIQAPRRPEAALNWSAAQT